MVMFPNKHVKIQRVVYPQEQLTTDYARNQSSTQMEILHLETVCWKKQIEKKSMYQCFLSLFFSSHCQFFLQPHSIRVKLPFAGTEQGRASVLHISSLQSIHVPYHFPSCLVTARASCRDLKAHGELPIQLLSCSRIKPDILPFPNKILQRDSLANHSKMKEVEVYSLSKLVPVLLKECFLDCIQKSQISFKPGIRFTCLPGR